MAKWKTVGDLLSEIEGAHARLQSGETPVNQAQAEARILSAGVKTLGVMLEHGRLTGRLANGSDDLPDVRIGSQKAKA